MFGLLLPFVIFLLFQIVGLIILLESECFLTVLLGEKYTLGEIALGKLLRKAVKSQIIVFLIVSFVSLNRS